MRRYGSVFLALSFSDVIGLAHIALNTRIALEAVCFTDLTRSPSALNSVANCCAVLTAPEAVSSTPWL